MDEQKVSCSSSWTLGPLASGLYETIFGCSWGVDGFWRLAFHLKRARRAKDSSPQPGTDSRLDFGVHSMSLGGAGDLVSRF